MWLVLLQVKSEAKEAIKHIQVRGTSCILYVHKHRATSPRDDECGRAPYDEHECAHVRTHTDEGVHKAHDTMGFR